MKRVCLGKIVGAHGIKGLVKIRPFGDDPTLIEQLSPLFTSEEGEEQVYIALKNSNGKIFLAEIRGVSDRTSAETYTGTELYAKRDMLPELEDSDGYYLEDLKNLTALNQAGEKIGMVRSADDFGAGTLLDFQPQMGQSFYVPLKKEYVADIDLEKETVTFLDSHKDMKIE